MADQPISLAQEIADRVGCYQLAAWLDALAESFGMEKGAFMPVPAVDEVKIDVPGHGLRLTLGHPHAGHVREGDPERWVLRLAEFDGHWSQPWPFGLDPSSATPDLARKMFGDDTSGLRERDVQQGDLRQTFFLRDGPAIGITWKDGLVGFVGMQLTRLGAAQPFIAAEPFTQD